MTVVSGLVILGFTVWTAVAFYVGTKLGKWMSRNC